MKPHISKFRGYNMWHCGSYEGYGCGITPREAYINWRDNMLRNIMPFG